jgi:hypothetical protein
MLVTILVIFFTCWGPFILNDTYIAVTGISLLKCHSKQYIFFVILCQQHFEPSAVRHIFTVRLLINAHSKLFSRFKKAKIQN